MQAHWRGVVWLTMLIVIGCDQSKPVAVESESNLISPQPVPASSDVPVELSQSASEVDAANFATPQSQQPAATEAEQSQLSMTEQPAELNSSFVTLQPITSDSPEELIHHLQDIDKALQDLIQSGGGNFLDEAGFIQAGLRLGRMKHEAGRQLAASPESNAEQRRAGVLAQLVALSHMSGLRDIESAKELEHFARQLAQSNDEDLAHQARVVLLGFELQSLQNGVRSEPSAVLAQARELVVRPQDGKYPEFMVLQEAQFVLQQMGYTEAAQTVKDILIEKFRTSPDAELRARAWLLETQDSEAYAAFSKAFKGLGGEQFDDTAAAAAAQGLYDAFPNNQTAEQLATALGSVEFSGEIELSKAMASVVQQALPSLPPAAISPVVKLLDAHQARMHVLDEPLHLDGLVDFQGQPLDWKSYAGKVVLVNFWAAGSVKCMRETPIIREAYEEFHSLGFDVLGVNMDQVLADGQQAVKRGNFPWKNYHSADPTALGFEAPFAQQLGVNAVPFQLLVGRSGRVVALHVRGEGLKPAIQKALESAN